MIAEWALVRTVRKVTLNQSLGGARSRISVNEDYTSVQCWPHGRVGSVLYEGRIPHASREERVESALENSVSGRIQLGSGTGGSGPFVPALNACGFLTDVGDARESCDTWLDAGVAPPWLSPRSSLDHWVLQGRRGIHHATAPVNAPTSKWDIASGSSPRLDPMVFSPAVLSRMLVQDVSRLVLGGDPTGTTLRCSVESIPGGHGVDVEGVASAPLLRGMDGQQLERPASITDAARLGRHPSGHVGPHGFVHNRLVVGRESPAADSASVSTGTIVDHARVLASDRQGCYLVASAEDECRPWSRSGWLPSPLALLDLGVWVGPWQAGSSGWVSRWLSVPYGVMNKEQLSWP